jgi:CheY-like chemotaxis protein
VPETATTPSVLVVDDDPAFLESSAGLLREFGYAVVRASSSAEGLAAMAEAEPGAALIGVGLEEGGGIALCRKMRETRAGRDLPIILVTTQREAQNRLKGLAAGADDFLERPFLPEELRIRVEIHLRERAQRRSLKRANERLSAINEVGMLLSSSLQAEDPYTPAAEAIAAEFMLDLAAIGIIAGRTLELRACAPERSAPRAKELLSRTGASRTLASGRLHFEVQKNGEHVCWAPIRDREGSMGVLALLSRRPDVFTDEDARAFQTVCGQLALAFRNQEFIGRIRAYSERLESLVRDRTATLERQNRFTSQIIDSPEVHARLLGVGVEPGSMTVAQFEQFVTAERKKYGDFLTELAIKGE